MQQDYPRKLKEDIIKHYKKYHNFVYTTRPINLSIKLNKHSLPVRSNSYNATTLATEPKGKYRW